jgi:ABC-type transport system involved in multi-copper enzyme maturation permease subunit
MSTATAPLPARRPAHRGPTRAIRAFFTGISAVGIKELRGRMRGRRAFIVLTVYLLLLSAFAFGIYAYLRQQAALQADTMFRDVMSERPFVTGLFTGAGGMALSADIGHAIFSGLLLVLTLLVLVLAPAFTTGAISMEREKQTIDLLVTTPLSTLGMVTGKLLSALTYVFLLILASVPLMAVVFVFGGVGPEDLARAYVILFATAFGMGAIGLFISALTRRTQTATVVTLIVVLVLTLGSAAIHEFWKVLSTATAQTQAGFIPVQRSDRAPQALLWLNPFVGDIDLICTTAPGGYQRYTCDYLAAVTGMPLFTSPQTSDCPPGMLCAVPAGGDVATFDLKMLDAVAVTDAGPAPAPVADVDPEPQALPAFGLPRDTFWPRSALAFVVVGIVLTLASAQLVSPTRRLHLPRRGRHVPATVLAAAVTSGPYDASHLIPADAGASPSDPSDGSDAIEEVPR